jgi:hypothetical protein
MDQLPHNEQKLTYNEMLQKLDELYEKKEKIELALSHIKYDIEFLETMIMYRYNKSEVKKKEWQY